MTEYRQPWRPLKIEGRKLRLQILDPRTAFELEPELVGVLGDQLAITAAAPDELLRAIWRHGTQRVNIREIIADPVRGPEMAVDKICKLAMLLAQCLMSAPVSASWTLAMFEKLVIGRVRLGRRGDIIEDLEEWEELGLLPFSKWKLMAAQLGQTFGPLWTRSPYSSGVRKPTHNIPRPESVPLAVDWANNLARLGSASSVDEILYCWTPVRMIEIVESSAYIAATEQRALDEAKRKQ